MTKNLDKEGLSSIVDNYQLFYVDLWGVVHNGVSLHTEAIKTLNEITKKKERLHFTHKCTKTQSCSKIFFRKIRHGKRN